MSPVETLLAVIDLGGRLRVAGDKLRMSLPAKTSPEVKDSIRQNKTALLQLLNSTLLVVESSLLNQIVFFTRDEETKQLLAACGAQAGNIYMRAELQGLVNRRVSSQELKLFHEAKQRFNGTIASERPQ